MRTRWATGKGATLLRPRLVGGGIKAAKCFACGANPFTSCVKWKEADGVRYVSDVKKTFCKARGK